MLLLCVCVEETSSTQNEEPLLQSYQLKPYKSERERCRRTINAPDSTGQEHPVASATARGSFYMASFPSTPSPYSTPMCLEAPSTPEKNLFASFRNVNDVNRLSEPA